MYRILAIIERDPAPLPAQSNLIVVSMVLPLGSWSSSATLLAQDQEPADRRGRPGPPCAGAAVEGDVPGGGHQCQHV